MPENEDLEKEQENTNEDIATKIELTDELSRELCFERILKGMRSLSTVIDSRKLLYDVLNIVNFYSNKEELETPRSDLHKILDKLDIENNFFLKENVHKKIHEYADKIYKVYQSSQNYADVIAKTEKNNNTPASHEIIAEAIKAFNTAKKETLLSEIVDIGMKNGIGGFSEWDNKLCIGCKLPCIVKCQRYVGKNYQSDILKLILQQLFPIESNTLLFPEFSSVAIACLCLEINPLVGKCFTDTSSSEILPMEEEFKNHLRVIESALSTEDLKVKSHTKNMTISEYGIWYEQQQKRYCKYRENNNKMRRKTYKMLLSIHKTEEALRKYIREDSCCHSYYPWLQICRITNDITLDCDIPRQDGLLPYKIHEKIKLILGYDENERYEKLKKIDNKASFLEELAETLKQDAIKANITLTVPIAIEAFAYYAGICITKTQYGKTSIDYNNQCNLLTGFSYDNISTAFEKFIDKGKRGNVSTETKKMKKEDAVTKVLSLFNQNDKYQNILDQHSSKCIKT